MIRRVKSRGREDSLLEISNLAGGSYRHVPSPDHGFSGHASSVELSAPHSSVNVEV